MRIVDDAGDNVPRIPAEGGVTCLYRAPDLVAAIDLKDACAALWTRPSLILNRLGGQDSVRVTHVSTLLLLPDAHVTLHAGPAFTGPALVGGGEEPTTPLSRTAHNKLSPLTHRLSARIEIN